MLHLHVMQRLNQGERTNMFMKSVTVPLMQTERICHLASVQKEEVKTTHTHTHASSVPLDANVLCHVRV